MPYLFVILHSFVICFRFVLDQLPYQLTDGAVDLSTEVQPYPYRRVPSRHLVLLIAQLDSAEGSNDMKMKIIMKYFSKLYRITRPET